MLFSLILLILASNQTWFCRFNIPVLTVEFIVIMLSFYDWESSFPSKINKSPHVFGIFIWASKSHFISLSVAGRSLLHPSLPISPWVSGCSFVHRDKKWCWTGSRRERCGIRGWSCSSLWLLGNGVKKILCFYQLAKSRRKENTLHVWFCSICCL